MSTRTRRLLQQAANDYQAEIMRAHKKQMADALKFPGGSVGCDGLSTMHGAAVIALAATATRIACGVSSVLTWTYVEDELPDADMTVIVAAEGEDEFWPGYLGDGNKWLNPEGLPFTSRVYAWAYFPAMPPKKGEG